MVLLTVVLLSDSLGLLQAENRPVPADPSGFGRYQLISQANPRYGYPVYEPFGRDL
jgi:hypothetical protein